MAATTESYSGYGLPLLGNARGDGAAFSYSPVEQQRLQQRPCTFLDVLLAPFICALACVGCVGGLTLLSCGACTYSLLACCGCAPEVRLEHMEKYVYGKELWQAYLDGEGILPDDPVRIFCQKFFGSERFLERVGGLFDQFDADDSGKLDKLELVELLASLSTALVGAMHGMDAEFSQTEEDHAKVKAAYSEMFEDKQLLMDRSTFLALAKLISAQLIVSASVNSGQSFVYDEPVKSTVTIEEIPEGDE